MGQGGVAKTENNEDVARGIVKLVQENEGLKQAAEKFLEENPSIKETDLNDEKKVVELFQGPKGEEFFKAIKDHLPKIEQIDKGPTIIQKADSFGKKLAVGMGEVAFGGLLSAGLTAAPFIGLGILAFVAIAAIGFVLFKNKEKIGEKAKDTGKKATQLLKNVIDKLPLRSPNAVNYLAQFEAEQIKENSDRVAKVNPLPDDAAFIKQYLLNRDGFQALKSLIVENKGAITVKDETGKDVELTLKDLERLQEKGNSTFKDDENGFKEELNKFKLIMSEKNQNKRKEVEAKQDIIHEKKYGSKGYLEKPAPSSALYSGSVANTELLKSIDEDKRRGVKDLLEKASGLKNTGQNEGFRQDFHNILRENHEIEDVTLEGNDSAELKPLAAKLNKLEPE